MTFKKDIRNLSDEALKDLVLSFNQPAYRAKQISEWLWKKHVREIGQMSNIPASLRDEIDKEYAVFSLSQHIVQQSSDGTIKVGFKLHDEHLVEGVLIPFEDRVTACISSQVGCSLSCTFCATGKLKMRRNLAAGEIYDQVVLLNEIALKNYKRHISNIVYMGMGEPLLNYSNVTRSIRMLCSPNGLGMSPKRITVSTVGVEKGMRRLADETLGVNLALSLHAATDTKRDKIIELNRQNPISKLKDAMRYYLEKNGDKAKITFEYVLLRNYNDSREDAERLAQICSTLPVFVNIIEFNPSSDIEFKKSSKESRNAFVEYLRQQRIRVKVRKSRGKDIDAACGQLANKVQDNT